MTEPGVEADRFQQDYSQVLQRFQQSLSALIGQFPVSTAAQLATYLQINRKAAWQIWKISKARNWAESAGFLPVAGSIDSFLAACENRAVPATLRQAVLDAFRSIELTGRLHGTDAQTLAATLRGLARDADDQIDLATRRAAFRANSTIWGTKAVASFAADFVRAGSEPNRIDNVSLGGEVGLTRLRADAALTIAGAFHAEPKDGKVVARSWEPLQPLGNPLTEWEPILPEFSTNLATRFRRVADFHGQPRLALAPGPLGDRGAATFVTGQVFRNVGRRVWTAERPRLWWSMHTHWPIELLQLDLFVHREIDWTPNKSVQTFSGVAGERSVYELVESEPALPLRAAVMPVSMTRADFEPSEIPNYLELLQWACARAGWRPEEFTGFRVRIEYPILPSTTVFSVDLPRQFDT